LKNNISKFAVVSSVSKMIRDELFRENLRIAESSSSAALMSVHDR